MQRRSHDIGLRIIDGIENFHNISGANQSEVAPKQLRIDLLNEGFSGACISANHRDG